MTRHSKGSFQVLGGKVLGVDHTLVLLETADGHELLRTCQLRDG
jgi:hypothetical protein